MRSPALPPDAVVLAYSRSFAFFALAPAAVVLTHARASTLGALVADAVMRADTGPLALLTVASLAPMFADARAATFFTLAASAVVRAARPRLLLGLGLLLPRLQPLLLVFCETLCGDHPEGDRQLPAHLHAEPLCGLGAEQRGGGIFRGLHGCCCGCNCRSRELRRLGHVAAMGHGLSALTRSGHVLRIPRCSTGTMQDYTLA